MNTRQKELTEYDYKCIEDFYYPKENKNEQEVTNVEEKYIKDVKNILNDKESDVNTYYPTYKSHEFDVIEDGNLFSLNYSRYGLVLLKNSSCNL